MMLHIFLSISLLTCEMVLQSFSTHFLKFITLIPQRKVFLKVKYLCCMNPEHSTFT